MASIMLAAIETASTTLRRPPTRMEDAHVAAAMLMAIGVTNSNAVEGVGFAALAGFTLWRAPKLLDDWRALSRQPVVWAFSALLLLIWTSQLWGTIGARGFWGEFERMMLLPWLLWPIRQRASVLLWSLLVGAAVSVAILTLRNLGPHGFSAGQVVTHGKDIGLLSASLGATFVIATTAPERVLRIGLLPRLGVQLILLWGMYLVGQRTPQIVSIVTVLLVLCLSNLSSEPRRWLASMAVLLALTVALCAAPPKKLATSVNILDDATSRPLTNHDLARATSWRLQLGLAAVRLWKESPWVGHGGETFKEGWSRLCTKEPESILVPGTGGPPSTLTTAHNGFLDELACRGVIGFGLLVTCLAMIARAAWRPPGNLVLAASLLAWCLFSFANATTQRGTFQIMLAAMVTCAAALRVGPKGEADRTLSTPPLAS